MKKIYTRQGDQGTTGLWGGQRVNKDDVRVEAYGTVDELNTAVGKVLSQGLPLNLRNQLETIQDLLFRLGSDLANPGWPLENPYLDVSQTGRFERWIDEYWDQLPEMRNFILPGGTPAAADLHWARAVCRRAERRAQTLASQVSINEVVLPFLNRLSDLLFVMARWANYDSGRNEVEWKSTDRGVED